MSGLWRLLNEFAKSSLTIIWYGTKFWRYRQAEWMASHPPGVPAPSWRWSNSQGRRPTPKELAHFEARRQSIRPTAIRRMTPDFFSGQVSDLGKISAWTRSCHNCNGKGSQGRSRITTRQQLFQVLRAHVTRDWHDWDDGPVMLVD